MTKLTRNAARRRHGSCSASTTVDSIDPFYAQQMSDGTLKLFAYLLLMEDPNPPPFICIEEPENGLYHKLLEVLAAEFRAHATGKPNAPQIFVTTHQPLLGRRTHARGSRGC